MCVFQKIFRFYSLLRFPPTLLLQPICGSPHIPPMPRSSPVPRAPPAILRWVMTWVGSESVMDRSWSRWLNDCARSAGGERRNTLRMGGAGELLFAPAGGEIVRRKYQGYFRGPSPVDSCGGIENCRRGDGENPGCYASLSRITSWILKMRPASYRRYGCGRSACQYAY